MTETEEHFRAFALAQPDPVLVLDVEGKILACNAAAAATWGSTIAEATGRDAFAGLPEAVATGRKNLFRQVILTNRAGRCEESHDSRIIEIRMTPVRDATGSVVKVATCQHDLTEQRRAEAAQEKTAQNLEAIVRNTPLAVICTDLDTKVTMWNQAAERIFGWSAEEALGRENPIIPIEKKEEYDRLRGAVQNGASYYSQILERRRKDGTWVFLNASSAALTNDRGEVVGLMGIFADVSEQVAAEVAMRESERKFRGAFENAAVGATLVDLSGRFVKVNRFLCNLLGYREEELVGKTFSDVTHPEDIQIGLDNMKRQVAGEMDFASFEKRYLRKDGGVVNLIISPALLRDDQGAPKCFIGLFQDVTERKRVEDGLRRSEEFVRNILDTVDEGFIVIDPAYRIVIANKAYCAQVGGTCDGIVGKHCYEVSHKTDRPCFEEGEDCAAHRVFQRGEPHTSLHKHRDAQGHLIYVETKGFPVKDDTGAVTAVIATINNITEKHLLEEERLKAQKLESIGTLAGGIAHDFNNLLQGVFGFISLAKKTCGQPEKSLAMLGQAEQALHMAINLTSQLLTFSKGGKPAKRRIAVAPVIENAARFALSGSRTKFTLEVPPGLWPIEADAGQIGQVVQNVVLNADQAMPAGGSVLVQARNLSPSDASLPPNLEKRDHVLIQIRDNGGGIPAEHLPRIFDPYFTTKDRGSGLGLATSYSIVKNHGGLIHVQSTVGMGTTVSLYLPAAAVSVEEARKLATRAAKRKGRILVMDDEEMVRIVIGELLREQGHLVAFAETGESALAVYRTAREAGEPFDVLILDRTIRGGAGGIETMQKVREIDTGVKAVMTSGYAADAAPVNYRELGFRAFLKKPFRGEELLELVNDLIT